MLVDSHCHLDLLKLEQEPLSAVLDEAREAGIEHMLCVSVSLERFPAMLQLIEPYPQVSASVGVHPDGIDVEDPDESRLLELANHPRIVAIGETGLDYFRSDRESCDWQRERFRTHIRAANTCCKPLIIHTRDAREDTIAILRDEGAEQAGGVMHCFTETWEMAQQAMELGFYISFSGIVTFKNAEELRDVAMRVPLDRMLIETDSPYLAPTPFRGKPNEPKYVGRVAETIAELRGMRAEELAGITSENFYRLFAAAQPA